MLNLEEKVACLRKGIFSALDNATLAAIAGRMGEREVDGEEVLFLRGEPGDEIFVIVAGGIEIFVDEHVIALLGPGEMFGEMAVLGGGARTAGGRARGRTRLLFLKEKALRVLVQQIPDLAFAIFRVLIERLDEANRLARFLAAEKRELGTLQVVEGELAGRTFPLYHQRAVLGKALGTAAADVLRVALPVEQAPLLERHALVRIDGPEILVEALDGEVEIHGAVIDGCVQVTQEDPVRIGGMVMHFRAIGAD